LPGDHRVLEPPDSIPNSEVKRYIADGSVGFPHVRVGHRQALIPNPVVHRATGFFYGSKRGAVLRNLTAGVVRWSKRYSRL
jgi:hypothetical protein